MGDIDTGAMRARVAAFWQHPAKSDGVIFKRDVARLLGVPEQSIFKVEPMADGKPAVTVVVGLP